MSRNANLAHVGGALLVSALHSMESNAVREARRDVLRRVDRSLAHAHRQAANVSTTAILLVGVGLVAYVVKDQRRSRIEARASQAVPDGADGRLLPSQLTVQLHKLTELVAADARLLRTHVRRTGRLARPGAHPPAGEAAHLANMYGRTTFTTPTRATRTGRAMSKSHHTSERRTGS